MPIILPNESDSDEDLDDRSTSPTNEDVAFSEEVENEIQFLMKRGYSRELAVEVQSIKSGGKSLFSSPSPSKSPSTSAKLEVTSNEASSTAPIAGICIKKESSEEKEQNSVRPSSADTRETNESPSEKSMSSKSSIAHKVIKTRCLEIKIPIFCT